MHTHRPRYGQMAIYLILLSVAIAVMTVSRRCSTAPPLAAVTSGDSAGDTIDVAIIYGPMSYFLYNDTLGGLNYDMLLKFEADTHTPLKLWPVVNLHDALRRLERRSFDMLASLPSDNAVKSRFLTTENVFLDRLVLLQLADEHGRVEVNSALDLADRTVSIQRESPAASRLANLSNEIGAPIEVEAEENLSEEYLSIKVAQGEIPLAVVNEKIARTMQKRYPRLSFDNPVSFTQFQVWLLPKGDTALLSRIDRWLIDFKDSPAYRQLLDRYE